MKRSSFLITLVLGMLFLPGALKAQSSFSLGDILNNKTLNGIAEAVTGTSSASAIDITGTWKYKGSVCALESDNIVKKAGASIATSILEKKLDTKFASVGIKSGACSFTFSNDSSFVTKVGKKSYSGTYSYNKSTGTLVLTYLQLMNLNAAVKTNGNNVSLLFDANKFVKLVTYLSKTSSKTSIKTLAALLNSYEGAKVGFKLEK